MDNILNGRSFKDILKTGEKLYLTGKSPRFYHDLKVNRYYYFQEVFDNNKYGEILLLAENKDGTGSSQWIDPDCIDWSKKINSFGIDENV